MKQLFITFFLIILPVTGCAESFEEQFESVAVGASRVSVEQKLGEARKTTSGRVPSDPFWGPQEGLEAVLGPRGQSTRNSADVSGNNGSVLEITD